jgi:putative sigma-54 modulation protein
LNLSAIIKLLAVLIFNKYMHITLSGVHLEITDAIRDYAMEKFRSLNKFAGHDSSTSLSVELSKTTAHHNHGDVFKAEAQLHLKGKNFSLNTTEEDLYKAIDVLRDMLSREIIQQKDKQLSIFKRGAQKIKRLLRRGNDY